MKPTIFVAILSGAILVIAKDTTKTKTLAPTPVVTPTPVVYTTSLCTITNAITSQVPSVWYSQTCVINSYTTTLLYISGLVVRFVMQVWGYVREEIERETKPGFDCVVL
ncbi:hypothetical protein K505DRAFT_365676 [Melanomma pulvis-pyrius CBS 109.77]|uniref:Ig-like domain-containing protein n=1 Tax=Melanomma pulvis-pyrius CBS 109.77 TaxID=1314802 RepID=A0A6A6WZK2_9PLEO|nr:hypothetical protein K505DRAFT_365676 [Melanomma pulvis-pyrius CBS 109.77]